MDYTYPGGKGLAGLYQWIVAKMRTHSVYVEPFAGKGGVFRNKPPALHSLLIDADASVIDWWRQLGHPGTTAVVGDGIRWMETTCQDLDDDALVYVDPPYVKSTRVRQNLYDHELGDADHRRVLQAALTASCGVMISGYPSELYVSLLADFWRFETQAITRGGTMRTEVLWTNYDPARASPHLAVEYSRLGGDYRERERVAKKVRRWVARLTALPRGERRAVLLALLDAERLGSTNSIAGGIDDAGDTVPDQQNRWWSTLVTSGGPDRTDAPDC